MLTRRSVVYPWEDIVALCRKYGIISLVDAAHAIGQVKTNVKHSDPDFWIAVRGL
jgi:selenocysteine lyase/cysteine desulfurase